METFETKNNTAELSAAFTFSSIAKRYRNGKFYLINSDDPNDVEMVDNYDLQSAAFSKAVAQKNSILMIKVQFIVSKDVLDNKEQIMKQTTVDFSLTDELKTKNYTSQFATNPSEYTDKTKYTFVVTKQIEFTFV